MAEKKFTDALSGQIAYEFGAHQQYIANAVYYDADALPRLAAFFYRQALEERNHAMMIIQYLMDRDAAVNIPGVEAPKSQFAGILDPVKLALEQEEKVTDQFRSLASLAREEGDFLGEQFVHWFLKEQVEEVALMTSLLQVLDRAKDNPLLAEDYLARERLGEEDDDPTAPEAAGGTL